MLYCFNVSRSIVFYNSLMSAIEDIVFLLGGCDLEMSEIRQMLKNYRQSDNPEYHIGYLDKDLQWGARLSSYRELIPGIKAKKIIGVEITEDIPLPPNYSGIDHHGDKSALSSSIEQVANLLHLTLTRYQTLIAINDRAYMPGMVAYGATADEISNIRKADRREQGVTVTDEQLAEQSIHHHSYIKSGVTVVNSLTEKFSAVTDLLFPYSSLLVYNDNALVYYGLNAGKLTNLFTGLTSECLAYSGGGMNGFMGITAQGLLSYPDKEPLITMIINAVHHE